MILWLIGCGTSSAPPPGAEPTPRLASEPDTVASQLVELVSEAELGMRLGAASERPRVINFWATWCGPCEAEMPLLAERARAHPEVEFVMVSLDLAKLREPKVEPFLEQRGLQHLTHWQLDATDPLMALPQLVPGWPDLLPVTLAVGVDGTPRGKRDGQLDDEGLARLIEAAAR